MFASTSHQGIKQIFSENRSLKIAILDNTNLGFFVQNHPFFRPIDVFLPYDFVCIPRWVLDEMCGDQKREEYLHLMNKTLPAPLVIVDEFDFLPLIGYQDQRLYYYFLAACVKFGGLRSFLIKEFEGKVVEADLPEEWLQRFYQEAFDRFSGRGGKKKNAGEISIFVFTHLLIHMFSTRIDSITWFSMDTDLLKMKEDAQKFLIEKGLWDESRLYPISFKSPDLLIKEAVQTGRIALSDIGRMRHQPRRMVYVVTNADGSIQSHERMVDTPFFLTNIVSNPNCQIIF